MKNEKHNSYDLNILNYNVALKLWGKWAESKSDGIAYLPRPDNIFYYKNQRADEKATLLEIRDLCYRQSKYFDNPELFRRSNEKILNTVSEAVSNINNQKKYNPEELVTFFHAKTFIKHINEPDIEGSFLQNNSAKKNFKCLAPYRSLHYKMLKFPEFLPSVTGLVTERNLLEDFNLFSRSEDQNSMANIYKISDEGLDVVDNTNISIDTIYDIPHYYIFHICIPNSILHNNELANIWPYDYEVETNNNSETNAFGDSPPFDNFAYSSKTLFPILTVRALRYDANKDVDSFPSNGYPQDISYLCELEGIVTDIDIVLLQELVGGLNMDVVFSEDNTTEEDPWETGLQMSLSF